MISPEIVAAFVTIAGAIIAGWFAYLTKKVHTRSPETVAGGYSVLVGDLRFELNRLTERVAHLEMERRTLTKEVESVNNQLKWLLNTVTDDDRQQFLLYFENEELT